MQTVMEWSKMNILFIYTCTNFAQILTYRLYIKMATYKRAKQNATKFKKNIVPWLQYNFPYALQRSHSWFVSNYNIIFIFLQKHF